MPKDRDQTPKGKRRPPHKPPAKEKARPVEKKQPKKKTDERQLSAFEEDELELQKMAEDLKNAEKISPGRLLMEMFLQAYLRTHNIYTAARAIVPEGLRKDKAHVAKVGRKMWRSRPFQRLLDEHLEEFGKKTRRMRRMTMIVLEKAMVEDSGLGGHAARVKAADTMSKILGMQEKKVTRKNVGATHLLVVPGIANLEEWENSAQKAQEALKKRVKDLHASAESNQEEIEEP